MPETHYTAQISILILSVGKLLSKVKQSNFSPYTALFTVHRLTKEDNTYMHSKMNTKISPRVTHQKLMDLFRYSYLILNKK